MLTNFIFLAVLSSGSVFCASRFEKRYEQTISLGAMGMVLLLFAFGLLGMLDAGVVCLYLLSVLFYVMTAVRLIRKRNLRQLLKNLVTPGSVLFVLACVLLSLWNHGKVASGWDEFSHWVDIVKAMLSVGDFGTNPAAESAFQSYPPAMALFQYSLQKLFMWMNPGYFFSEWRMYFAYQVFFLAVLLPVFREVTFLQPVKLLLYGGIIFLIPLMFYANLYSTVYIDPILAILFAAGMVQTLLDTNRDGWRTAYVCMICAMLTLSKDAGFVFAMILGITYGADCLLDKNVPVKKRWLAAPLALAAAWLSKQLWTLELETSGAKLSFSGEIQWPVLLDVLTGKDTSYRSTLIGTYRDALFSKGIVLERLDLNISYITLGLILLCGLLLVWWLYRTYCPAQGKRWGILLGIAAATVPAYTAGLCVTYMFKFSQYEAVRLASMERYLNIAYLGVWMLILLLLTNWLCQCCKRRGVKLALLLFFALTVPVEPFRDFMQGAYVESSVNARTPYEVLSREIRQKCDGDDRIYYISQESSGYDYWVSRFNARPNSFSENFSWSIGEPFYDGDVWTKNMTADQWQAMLLEGYDYVALYRINDYFLENYSHLFAQPEEIAVNTLYRVNLQTGLLEKCR